MGAYLSEPITEKNSSDEVNELLACGSSSMQGWRINQEDAHNCLLKFDRDTSFFAVYDGHGGPEIALYCSQKLPEYLKNSDAYKVGDMEKALKDAFLGFDDTLLQPEVIEELKLLAGDKYPEHGEETETDEEEDLAELCQESRMPLTEVLEKYKEAKVEAGGVAKLKGKEHKPLSPFLRAQKSDGASPSSSGAGSSSQATDSTASGPSGASGSSGWRPTRKLESEIDSTVSSSSTSEKTAEPPREANEASECETNGGKESYNSPDSSSSSSTVRKSVDVEPEKPGSSTDQVARPPDVKIPNGEGDEAAVSASSSGPPPGGAQEPEISTNSGKGEGVSSSSSAVQENGEVSSNSGGCSSTNDRLPKRSAAPLHIPTTDANTSSSDSEDDMDETYNENTSSTEDVGDEDSEMEENNSEFDEEGSEEECAHEEVDDTFMNNMIEEPGKDSGCTAVVALLAGKDLYVANAGDSRCVVCRDGKAIEMSFDHKPEDEIEHTRITNAGGKVTIDGRVNGGLNLSRAIGDHAYKMNFELPPDQQMISALPDVKKITLMPDDEFMVLACDGIWNFMSSESVVEFVKERLDEGRERLSQICEELFDNCLAKDTTGDGTGCDNMTAIIVKFPRGEAREGVAKLAVETSEAVLSSKKRSASTDAKEESDADGAKRLKTDDELPAVVVDTDVDNVSST